MTYDPFTWQTMSRTINVIKRKPGLLFQELVFKQRNTNSSEKISFDRMRSKRRLLPVVSPVGPGTILAKQSYETAEVTAPRLRPKKPFSAPELLTQRAPGQIPWLIGGENAPQTAKERKLADELADMRDRVDLTLEYFCGQALQGGQITVTQEDIAFRVDYQMPAGNKITLSGTDKWSDAASNPGADLMAWSDKTVAQTGLSLDFAIMGTTACSAFVNNPAVKAELDVRRVEAGGLAPTVKSNFMGNYRGVDVYRYGGTYEDASGSAVSFLGADKVVAGSSLADVSIEFGLILDLDADASVQAEYFSKSWMEKDPSVMWILAESRPLPVLWLPEAFVFADVV